MAIRYIQKNKDNVWSISNTKSGKSIRNAATQKEAIALAGSMKSTEAIMIKRSSGWQESTGWDEQVANVTKLSTKKETKKATETKTTKTASKAKDRKVVKVNAKNDEQEVNKVEKQSNRKLRKVEKAEGKAAKKSTNHVVRLDESDELVLNVKSVTKKFGTFTALEDISFQVKKGERIGLIGGNGAGKTTVSEIIAGINKPTSGTIEYGFEFEDTPKEGIGMQFQQSNYPSGLTVKDIVMFAKNLRKLKMTDQEVKELLAIFQMEDFYTRKVRSLSGGQRQKLNILMSIIHNPKLVILDELSTGLDISAREDIIEFTDELLTKNKMSAILISHHMAEIEALCTKVVILERGEVIDIALIKDIEKEHGSLSKYSKKLIAQANIRAMEIERDKNDGKTSDKFEKLNKKKTLLEIKQNNRIAQLKENGYTEADITEDKKLIKIQNNLESVNNKIAIEAEGNGDK